jgi:hypothetical protein
MGWNDGVLCGKWHKELQDFPRSRHLDDSEILHGEPAARSIFRNSGTSNRLFPTPGDKAECSDLVTI